MVRLLVLMLLEGILPAADGVAPDPYFPAFHARMHADHNNGARPLAPSLSASWSVSRLL